MSGGYRGKRAVRTRHRAVILIVAAAAALTVATAAALLQNAPPQAPDSVSGAGSASRSENVGAAGPAVSTDRDPAAPIQAPDTSQPGPEPMAVTAPEAEPYDFSQPAPEREAVDNSYFDDAAFVGDSRTDGFMLYSGIGTGKNLTSNGLSIFKLAEKKALKIGGEEYTLLEALALEEYGKVYLSLGVNELGYGNDREYYVKYGEAIDAIRQAQPNAVIYIQGLIPLNEGQIKEVNGNKFHLTNDHLRTYNDLMKQVAEEKQVVYLDLYTEFVDENAELPRQASRDGVHLVKESCRQWLEYLKTHTVDFDTLYPDGPPAAETPEPTTADGSGQA